MLAPALAPLPAFTAVLFGLTGCLVDFGAQAAKRPVDGAQGQPTAGALPVLQTLNRQGVPCAWLEELPQTTSEVLARSLAPLIVQAPLASTPWPAPNACWQALMALGVNQLEGSVLVSGEPKLLQSGLNAGLWTIGLASCGSLCGLSLVQWQGLTNAEREYRRGQATLQLYALGVHSVIDHLGELESCLADIALRRSKGEKP
ncbi:MAG TPA: HAD family phosphatase [Pseudomonas sp.]|jgi:beta-phosphoglucomutase-like phosphatase (HAD superfamily)